MEMSSPLAAMHPPPIAAPWGYRRDLPQSKPLFGAHTFGQKSFNFRDMSMQVKKPTPDYFTLQPMRGSSPTASLAADMSSNLHVDQRYPPLHAGPAARQLTLPQSPARDSPPVALHFEPVPAALGQSRYEAARLEAAVQRR